MKAIPKAFFDAERAPHHLFGSDNLYLFHAHWDNTRTGGFANPIADASRFTAMNMGLIPAAVWQWILEGRWGTKNVMVLMSYVWHVKGPLPLQILQSRPEAEDWSDESLSLFLGGLQQLVEFSRSNETPFSQVFSNVAPKILDHFQDFRELFEESLDQLKKNPSEELWVAFEQLAAQSTPRRSSDEEALFEAVKQFVLVSKRHILASQDSYWREHIHSFSPDLEKTPLDSLRWKSFLAIPWN
jgi:hypothetical protein